MNPYKNQEAIKLKTRENLYRRQADRLGLFIKKSKVMLVHVDNLGGYRITDQEKKVVLAGQKFELTLDEVKAWLDQYEAKIIAERKQSLP